MYLFNTKFLTIFFADSFFSIDHNLLKSLTQIEIAKLDTLIQLRAKLDFDELCYIKQIHSNIGYIIDKNNSLSNNLEGDFLITKERKIALSVYTADCLPVVIYDIKNHVVGICHAGWKGSVKEILLKSIEKMCSYYKTNIANLLFYFGPSAKVCCYEVQSDFLGNLKNFNIPSSFTRQENNQFYFDLVSFNIWQLKKIGAQDQAFDLSANVCTICNKDFCSIRANNTLQRQLNIVILK